VLIYFEQQYAGDKLFEFNKKNIYGMIFLPAFFTSIKKLLVV
jgi:hypothetical protein